MQLINVHNFYPIIMKINQNEVNTYEYHILTKFHNDWAKIVDFFFFFFFFENSMILGES